jgi:hypothetical protein
MIYFTDEQIAAKELRDAAYHEAGHKMLYRCFGGDGDAVVWKNGSANPEEKMWLGQFSPRTCPEVARNLALTHGSNAPDLPADWRILVGMADLLAEEILSDETDDAGVMADNLFFRISSGEASATDLAQMGVTVIESCEVSCEVVEEAVRLLREEWAVVQEEAEGGQLLPKPPHWSTTGPASDRSPSPLRIQSARWLKIHPARTYHHEALRSEGTLLITLILDSE